MDEFNRLYSVLTNPKHDLLSLDIKEFEELFKDSSYKQKVFNSITKHNLYSGDYNKFEKQFALSDVDVDVDVATKEKLPTTYNPNTWKEEDGFIELNDTELKGAKFTKKNLDNLLNNSEYAPYIDENGVLDITKVPDELKRKMLLEANSNKDIPATLIRQEENTVVGLLNEKYPALKGRFNTAEGFGNMITVDLLNGEKIVIDLTDNVTGYLNFNDEEKAENALKQLDKWYTNINEKKLGAINSLLDINWKGTGKGWLESLPELAQQFEKIGYTLETSSIWNVLKKDGEEVLKFLKQDGKKLSEFLMNNLSDKDITKLLDGSISDYEVHANNVEKREEELKKEITIEDNDVIWNAFKNDDFLNSLTLLTKNAGMSDDGIEKLKNILTNEHILPTKEHLNTSLKNENDYDEIKALNTENKVIQSRNKERNDNAYSYFLNNFVNAIDDPENGLSEKDRNILIGKIAGEKNILNNALAYVNQNSKNELIDRKLLLFSEKLAKDNGAIRLGVWAKKIELDEKLGDVKSLVDGLKLDQKTFKITVDSEFKNLVSIAEKNGWGFSVDIDGDEQYIVKKVTGSEKFKSQVSRLVNTINNRINEHEASILNIEESNKHYELQNNAFKQISDVAFKEYDLGTIMMNDFSSAVAEMFLSVPSLFGSDWAQNNMTDLNTKKQRYETHRTWDEAALGGVRDRWFWRNGAQQSPNLLLAVGTVGYGTSLLAPRAALGLTTVRGGRVISSLSGAGRASALRGAANIKKANEIAQKWAMNLVATEFGIISAGSKANQLTMEQDARTIAFDTKKWLIKNKDNMPHEDWVNQMLNVEKTIALGDMTQLQKNSSVVFTGLVEGGFTRFFGTIPNSVSQIRNWMGPVSKKLAQGYTTGLQNAANTIGIATWQVGSEVIEETGIEFGTVLGDGLILGRDFDFSQMKDVAMSAIMIAGPMNGPGTAYAGIVNHINNASNRQEINSIKSEIDNIQKDFKNLLNTKVGIGNQQLTQEETELFYERWRNVTSRAANVTKGLEVDAMLLGGEGVGRLFKNERILKELYDEAGVNHNDPVGVRNAKIKLYHKKLTETEVKQWNARRENAEKSSRELVESIDYSGKIKQIFGDNGLDIAKKINAKNNREGLIKVADEIKKQADLNIIEKTKNNPNNKRIVEEEIYSIRDKKGKITKRQDFKGSKRKRRNLKKENAYYLTLGKWDSKTEEEFAEDVKAVKKFYEQAGKKIEDYVVENDPRKFKKAYVKIFGNEKAKGIENENAFYDDVSKKLYINKSVAIFQGAKNTTSHEFLHFLVSPLLTKDKKGDLTKGALKLIDGFKKRLGATNLQIVEDRLQSKGYFKRNEKGEIEGDVQEYAEEYLTQFFEAIRDGDIKFDQGILEKILQWFQQLFGTKGYEFQGITDGREFYDFVREYATNVEEGVLNKSFVALVDKSIKQKVGKAKPKKSLTPKENVVLATKLKDMQAGKITVGDFLKDPNVTAHVNKVAHTAFGLFYKGDVPNYVDKRTYLDSAKTDLSIIALKWKPKKGTFDRFLANRGMQRLNDLATDLGVPTRKERGGPGFTTTLDDAKDVAVYQDHSNLNPFNSKKTTELNKLTDLEFLDKLNLDEITEMRLYRAVADFMNTNFEDYNTVTRNRSVTPFVAGLKAFLANKKGDGFHAIKTFMGKGDNLKNFLKKNKNNILKNATTTWLSKNYPKVILKSVGGKWRVNMEGKLVEDEDGNNIFDPNWVPYDEWKDAKKIDEQKSTKGGPTSGPQLMMRDINAIEKTPRTEFAQNFFKPNGNVDQGKQESVAQTITQEGGIELFKKDLNKKDENGQPVGPLFGKFRTKQQELKRQVHHNAVEELSKQLDRGRAKMSKTVRGLPDKLKLIFNQKLPQVAQKIADGADINTAIRDVYTNLLHPTQVTNIVKDFKRLIKLHEVYDTQYKEIDTKFQPLYEFLIDNISNFDTKMDNYLGTPNRSVLFDDKNRLTTYRGVPLHYANKMLEMKDDDGNLLYTKEQIVTTLLKWHKQHLTSSGTKIARGQYYPNSKGELVEDKNWNPRHPKGHKKAGERKESRYQGFGPVTDMVKWTVNQIPGVEVNALGKGIIDGNEVNLDVKPPAQSVKEGLSITSEESLKNAEEARKELKNFTQYLADRVNDTTKDENGDYNDNFDKADMAMMMSGMNSSKQGLIRAAADVRYRYIPKKGEKKLSNSKLRYEHMTPADFISMKVIDYYMNPNTEVDLDLVLKNYHVAIIPVTMDTVVNDIGYKQVMPANHLDGDVFPKRYYNTRSFGNKNVYAIKSIRPEDKGKILGQSFVNIYNETKDKKLSSWKDVERYQIEEQAKLNAYNVKQPIKGMSVIDFDDTLVTSKSKIHYTIPRQNEDGSFNMYVVGSMATLKDSGSLTPAEFAKRHDELAAAGAIFDYSEFNKVIDGKKGPFFNKAQALKKKFGNKEIYILTARPKEAAPAIQAFLKGVGLDIKIENIIGLEDGRPEAKADWITEKAAEGYNDILFADDQIKNVKAVKSVLDKFDIKGKTYQARGKLSRNAGDSFNKILEINKGIVAEAEFSAVAARSRGYNIGKWQFFIPPSAEDFAGLMYPFLGKGKIGDQQKAWFEKVLFKPFARGIRDINAAKQRISNEFISLKKQHPEASKILSKTTGYNNFTYDNAARVYLWQKNGIDIPGLSKRDIKALVKIVKANPELQTFADNLSGITRLDTGYVVPTKSWFSGTIAMDILDVNTKINREKYLQEWLNNKNEIFTPNNLNKIEALFGTLHRSAIEDMLYRMEHGTHRKKGQSRLTNSMQDWVAGAVGNIMFLHTRSATLQFISFVNFANWSDNNPLKAGAAFVNQPQFWKDVMMIFKSDFLKQRRAGLQIDVNANEIATIVAHSKNKYKAALAYLLQKGYTPTKIMDSFAIAFGGATMYRNRVNTYLKQGMTQKDAENKAFLDMQEIAESTQQSARPDLISQQQASWVGRTILNFTNVTMQYNRQAKKAILDLINRRGDPKTNISKIIYYVGVQNLVFNALQQALFVLIFDDEEEEKTKKRYLNLANGMADTILRGMGIYGAIVSTIKNMVLEFKKQSDKGYMADYGQVVIDAVNVSPPLGSKARKFYNVTNTYKYNQRAMNKMGFDIDNPAYDAVGNLISIGLNIPTDRVLSKVDNVRAALDNQNAAWQRVATGLGWPTWSVGIQNEKVQDANKKEKTKKSKKNKRNIRW